LHFGSNISAEHPCRLIGIGIHTAKLPFWPIACKGSEATGAQKETAMTIVSSKMSWAKELLERKEAELAHMLRNRDGIAIEKSADQMDEIQYASERDLAIRNVDRDSSLLRQIKAALARIDDGTFGTCIECESAIGPKRLAAVPWAARCIACQETADRNRREGTDLGEDLVNAA
jgi:DnaK suppressor protein